ncbi:MAG: outer membrane protein assembly factor BamB family protein [Planctomycetota bacterium]|jgi:outer membrane protein assembly factor BamB
MKRAAIALIVALASAAPSVAESGGDIVRSSGLKGGLIVHIGCGDGRLTRGLLAGDTFLVCGLDTDARKVSAAREYIRSEGVYGKVSVQRLTGANLPFADNLVNLVIAENPSPVGADEVMRILRPGGSAYIKKAGNWTKTDKPWPADIDEWTHWLHNASGNAVARDRVAGPPRHLQWMARPFWARLHDAPSTTSAMVSANGRIFYISDEAPAGIYENLEDKWFLVARDAFNGVLLWKKPLPRWGWKQWTADWHARNNQPFQLPKRLVAVGDIVYVTLAFNAPLTALDAATGRVLKTYEGTDNTDEILAHKGLLIVGLNNTKHRPTAGDTAPIKKSIAVLKADTGEMLWKKGDYTGLSAKVDSIAPVGRLELAVGNGRVFFSDHDAIAALDLEDGNELWRVPRPGGPRQKANFKTQMGELCTLVYSGNVVLFAQPEGGIGFHSCPGTLYAFAADDGKLLWKHPYGGWVHNTQPNVFVIDGVVWIHEHQDIKGKKPKLEIQQTLDYAVLGLNLMNGRRKHRYSTRSIFDVGHHHRCYRNKATERFLLTSRRGVEFTDTASGEIDLNHWTRGDCHMGVMPCNGMLYTSPHPCSCYIDTKLNGYFCLAPEQSAAPDTDKPLLLKGPAYAQIENRKSKIVNPNDWSTFRANAARSGSVKGSVSANLKEQWKTDLGEKIGPVSVADNRVFVPVVDEHRVVALDCSTGKVLWDFTAGGRVNTPPTIHKGMALFGSADGWAYCLQVSDGELSWARRLAPRDRLIGSMGQLESAWPVHGSILVGETPSGAVAYAAAGRSSYLDGGIHLYALQPESGQVIEHRVEHSLDPKTGKMPAGDASNVPGMLADILVGNGTAVWMRRHQVFGGSQEKQQHVYATGGFRDDTWFNRTTWSMGNANHAQLLVFDESTAYGIEAFQSTSRKTPFAAGAKGYHLFATTLKKSNSQKSSGRKKKGSPRKTFVWSKHVPVRGNAMALAGDVLFVAGTPDTIDPADPLAAFEGRNGGVLYAISSSDGERLSRKDLDSPPVLDGVAAANGRLYISQIDGNVICFDGR